MSTPSYQELAAHHEAHWITYGPNSGGQEGWFLYQGKMFFYGGDWGMNEPVVSPGISISEFLRSYQQSDQPKLQAIVQELLSRVP